MCLQTKQCQHKPLSAVQIYRHLRCFGVCSDSGGVFRSSTDHHWNGLVLVVRTANWWELINLQGLSILLLRRICSQFLCRFSIHIHYINGYLNLHHHIAMAGLRYMICINSFSSMCIHSIQWSPLLDAHTTHYYINMRDLSYIFLLQHIYSLLWYVLCILLCQSS